MKLAAKLIVALVLGITAVMALNAYLRGRGETALFRADTVRDLRTMGRAVSLAVEAFQRIGDDSLGEQLVREVNANRDDMEIRWMWLDRAGLDGVGEGLTADRLERLREGVQVNLVRTSPSGEQRRYLYWPLKTQGARPAALELSKSLATQIAFIRASRNIRVMTSLGLSAVCGLIAAGLGYWFVGKPIALLRDKARRVGAGDLSGRLRVKQHDEIGELASEIDAMCDRLEEAQRKAASAAEARIEMLQQLRHADRLKTVGQLASGVAHELGTPLNVVSGHAKLIRRGEIAAEEIGSSAGVIIEQTDRMTSIIRQLLDFSRRRNADLHAANLCDITSRTVEMLTPLADKRQVALELDDPSDPILVEADSVQIQQALANLIVNGIEASSQGGRVEVRVAHRRVRPPAEVGGGEGDFECVVVSDRGTGISAEHIPHLFEPFFTTKDIGEGTGLGLAVAYGIVREHGGWIDVESKVGEGTRFSLFLRPATSNGAAAGRRVPA